MKRVCILVMDSFGIGASLDAKSYGDEGAHTFGHIYQACALGEADKPHLRKGPLFIPNLTKLGLHHASMASSGFTLEPMHTLAEPQGCYGYGVETSLGKDTPSGHWEMAGVPVDFEWGYFPDTSPCFPKKLIDSFIKQANIPGVLGLKHASGTEIIEEYGEEHMRTHQPIVYTSADSVFQIAAHEETFGLERLYEICEVARVLVDEYRIGRVIARPFIGTPGNFKRTGNRHDYTTPPPAPTLLDILQSHRYATIAIGKIADIFAHQGVTETILVSGNMPIFDATLEAFKSAKPGSLIFSNFVDFDSSYGHRRDVPGYAKALEEFDARLPELLSLLTDNDMIVIAADHGCDPTFPGSDHTREHIPILTYSPGIPSRFIGRRDSFADIGQSIATFFGIPPLRHGVSFL
jgi:phosphopentomutase